MLREEIETDAVCREPDAMPRIPAETRWRRIYREQYNLIWGLLAIAFFLISWEVALRVRIVPPLFISGPSLIWQAFVDYVASGRIFVDVRTSLWEFFLGMVIAIVAGIPLGIIYGWYRYPYAFLTPFVSALYATPRIAFAPLVIVWFGIGLAPKVFLVAFGAFFPILLNTSLAFRTINPDFMKAAKSFRASDWQIFRTLAVPGSVPAIVTGIRLGTGRGLIGMIVGEFYASNVGVGSMIAKAGQIMQTDTLFVGILMIATLGIAVSNLLTRVECYFNAWRVAALGRD